MVCAGGGETDDGTARRGSRGAARFPGRGAQGCGSVGLSGCFAACLFLCADALPAGAARTSHRSAVSAEHGERGRSHTRSNVAGLAGASGRSFLAGDAYVHGKHTTARHRCSEHGAVARSTRTTSGHSLSRVRGFTAGCGALAARYAESAAGGGAGRFAAAGDFGAEETHVHSAVGRVAARTIARADGSELRRPRSGACGLSAYGRDANGLDGFSCRENDVVAPVVVICVERVVPPTPRRINFLLRYTEKHANEYSWDQCVPRERFGGDCLRWAADRCGRGGKI